MPGVRPSSLVPHLRFLFCGFVKSSRCDAIFSVTATFIYAIGYSLKSFCFLSNIEHANTSVTFLYMYISFALGKGRISKLGLLFPSIFESENCGSYLESEN